jgi:hypothetical protein
MEYTASYWSWRINKEECRSAACNVSNFSCLSNCSIQFTTCRYLDSSVYSSSAAEISLRSFFEGFVGWQGSCVPTLCASCVEATQLISRSRRSWQFPSMKYRILILNIEAYAARAQHVTKCPLSSLHSIDSCK